MNCSATNGGGKERGGFEDPSVMKMALFTCQFNHEGGQKSTNAHNVLVNIAYHPNFNSPTLDLHIRQRPQRGNVLVFRIPNLLNVLRRPSLKPLIQVSKSKSVNASYILTKNCFASICMFLSCSIRCSWPPPLCHGARTNVRSFATTVKRCRRPIEVGHLVETMLRSNRKPPTDQQMSK
jgi:hypothetical protein